MCSVPSGYCVAFGDEKDQRCVFEMVYYDPSLEGSVDEVDYGSATIDEDEHVREFPGLEVPKEAVTVDSKVIGDGNFGQVFQGKVAGLPKSVSPDGAVVLKKAKDRVKDSDVMLELELEMNYRITERAPGTCANYLGFCDIERGQGGALYNKKLSDGLWLIWKSEARYELFRNFIRYLIRYLIQGEVLTIPFLNPLLNPLLNPKRGTNYSVPCAVHVVEPRIIVLPSHISGS